MKSIKYLYKVIFLNKFISPLIILKPINIIKYFNFWVDYFNYRLLNQSEKVFLKDLRPILEDKTQFQSIDSHYFFQGIWAANKIMKKQTKEHIDIGSLIDFVGFLTTFTKVKYVDIRPLKTKVSNLEVIMGDILNLPFSSNSINSISCLHVAEHIGLGRYGDKLDPLGTKKACIELSRILSINGDLYFSLPIGQEKTYFNAHRVHSPLKIKEYFKDLDLIEFSAIDDRGNFIENILLLELFQNSKYACGLFHFKKNS